MPPSGVDYASEFLNGYAPEYVLKSGKLLDGNSHVIIDHHGWCTLDIHKEVTVRFHKGQCVLVTEEIGMATVT